MKYREGVDRFLPATVKAWAEDGLRLTAPEESWVSREAAWSNYYLRSNVTYDDLFQQHFISQAGVYLYINGPGRDGGGRDSPLHAMPLIFTPRQPYSSV